MNTIGIVRMAARLAPLSAVPAALAREENVR